MQLFDYKCKLQRRLRLRAITARKNRGEESNVKKKKKIKREKEKRDRSRKNFFILQQKLLQCLFVRSVGSFACLFLRLFAGLFVFSLVCLLVPVCLPPFDAVLAVQS